MKTVFEAYKAAKKSKAQYKAIIQVSPGEFKVETKKRKLMPCEILCGYFENGIFFNLLKIKY